MTQNGCVPCSHVKNYLNDRNVVYTPINVSEQREYIEKYNLMSTPVSILIDEDGEELDRSNGYNPDELHGLIMQM